MFFANEQREKVREENPGISFGIVSPLLARLISVSLFILTRSTGQVGKMLGEKWKGLSDDERHPYVEKAAADRKRYDEEKKSYLVRGLPLLLCCVMSLQKRSILANVGVLQRIRLATRRNRPKCQNLTGSTPCL